MRGFPEGLTKCALQRICDLNLGASRSHAGARVGQIIKCDRPMISVNHESTTKYHGCSCNSQHTELDVDFANALRGRCKDLLPSDLMRQG